MAKFKARAGAEVDAFQWNGQPPREWPQWARDSIRLRYELTNIQVDGKYGAVRVDKGDWIIRKSDDDIYPCSDEVFHESWEPA